MKIKTTPDHIELCADDLKKIVAEAIERETGRRPAMSGVIFKSINDIVFASAYLQPVAQQQWKIQYRHIGSGQWVDDSETRFATENSAFDCLKSFGVIVPMTNVREVPA